ncbi:lytic murein transglycosylase [Sagittula salina]|uniref:Lytic murein transglycosylase n=1 Tax=Sagittula salina TaxID=2820268 RepID=A0A940MPB0_9RHOB|nr:lytic murein transglycosylase [Sagittula salina]MBP0482422.1 lytic murein transglycosylase [Sagittula salina]
MIRQIAFGLGGFLLGCAPLYAEPLDVSLRPQARVRVVVTDIEEVVSRALAMDARLAALSAPGTSLRPTVRPAALHRVAAVALVAAPTAGPHGGTEAGFHRWINDFRPRALAQGISARTFDRAFAGVRFDPAIVAKDEKQAEFVKGIWSYLDSATSDSRVENGRAMLRQHGALLDRIERTYGVDKEIVLAVWGMESAYGSYRGSENVVEAMASLAYDGRRAKFFETQLVAALQILEAGDTTPANMKGSWAGAMGHTQFMPTSFQSLAVDFTGDGRRDIWGDDPADALASTAHYLAKNGWVTGMPWGMEVRLPAQFDYTAMDTDRMPSDWARLGVVGMDGRPVRDFGAARVLLPAGHRGAAFLVSKNFRVIKRYNAADAYALGVAHLADRIAGGAPFRGAWPREDSPLTSDQRKELQARLTAVGFSTGGVDGRLGPNSIAAIRGYQARRGLVPDGYASMELLKKLR